MNRKGVILTQILFIGLMIAVIGVIGYAIATNKSPFTNQLTLLHKVRTILKLNTPSSSTAVATTLSPTPGLTTFGSVTKRPEPSLAPTAKPTSPLETLVSPTPFKEKIPNSLGNITIKGDENCISTTQEALQLLQDKAATHYSVVSKYIGIIECTETGSGMYAWEKPTRYQVGKSTYNAGTTWYAGTIAHDACHSKQYQDYSTNNPSSSVPNDVFTGKAAEAQCLDAQYDALTKIGADQNALNYVKNIINSEYWNIDYSNRWW